MMTPTCRGWHSCGCGPQHRPPPVLHASAAAALLLQGKADRNCRRTKTMMFNNPAVLHALLEHLTEALIAYVGYQIEAGAQVRGTRGHSCCLRLWFTGCLVNVRV